MTARTARCDRARSYGGRVAGLRRAVVIVFAALVVLVHHQAADVAIATPSPSAVPATHGMGHTPGMAMPTGSAAPAQEHPEQEHSESRADAPPAESRWDAPGHGPCTSASMQHCASAGVDAVKLTPPHSTPTGYAPDADAAVSHRMAAAASQRAPPDLSVLSRLLI